MSEHDAPPDALAALIRSAGKREAPPAQAYDRALAAATAAWDLKVRRRRRWRVAGGLAAGVAAASIGGFIAFSALDTPTPSARFVAQVERVIGAVEVRPLDSRSWMSLRDDAAPLSSGAALRTESGSAAALRFGATSVRIADATELVIESDSRLRLLVGKVYIDTGGAGDAGRMVVATSAGTASDIGTQFEVSYRDERYRLRVREGEVVLQRDAERVFGRAGDEVSVSADGSVRTATIAAHDPEWRWIHQLAAAPDIDDQPLTVLLAWVARETGARVRYASPEAERRAATAILHGSIRHLAPLEALAVMLATTDLRHEVLSDGTIMIR